MNDKHYFGSTAFNWATGETREEVLQKLARMAGADIIKRNVKANGGGLYAWTVQVNAPQSAHYEINNYAPSGVPTEQAQAFNILNAKGKASPIN